MSYKPSRFRSLARVSILAVAWACSDEGDPAELQDAGSDATSTGSDATSTGSDTTSTDSTDGTDTGTDTADPNDDCVSDMYWMSGNMGSQFMHPGRDCLACHQNFNEVPGLVLAGTVYENLHEVDECDGVEGVTVTITDFNGVVFQTTTNAAGNFGLFEPSLVPPYTARLDWQGRTRMMAAEQTPTSCNSCHSLSGAEQAPGRILAP
jgi:hypothetical protein